MISECLLRHFFIAFIMNVSTKEGCADMNAVDVLAELEALGTERTKKSYLASGAREPLFGTATGKMKPILKKTGSIKHLQTSYMIRKITMRCILRA